MSGGSWEYAYIQLDELADRLLGERCEYRRALGRKLKPFAAALHDIEWVDSGDGAPGDGIPAIKKALGEGCEALAYAELRQDAMVLIDKLETLLRTLD
jgi:hypothetical protein